MELIDKDKLDSFKFRSASERMDLSVEYMSGWNDAIYHIEANAPTVDAVPVRHGKWKKSGNWGRVYKCDQCGNYLDFDGVNAGRGDANYCPNCGAKMDEVEE